MRTARALLLVLPVLLVAGGASAAGKHDQTRRSAAKKSRQAESRRSHGHADSDGGSSDFWGSCLSGCFSTGCDIAGEVAADSLRDTGEEPVPVAPPAPGLEAWPMEPEPPVEEEPTARELPPSLVPGEAPLPEEEDAVAAPPWMPDPAEDPAQLVAEGAAPAEGLPASDGEGRGEDDVATRTAAGAGHARRVPAIAPGTVLPDAPEPDASAGDFHAPEAYGLAAPPAPPPAPPPSGWNGRFDLRTTGAWIVADTPNASFDARASVGARAAGPGLQVWYTGLWERVDGAWDHLPVGGVRLAFGFGDGVVRPELRLGGALLHLGERDNLAAFDAGLGFEIRTGGEGAPWIDLGADVLVFEGFTASDLTGGVSFPGGPFYVRVGVRSTYLETFYAGPEVALGLRL